jgi:aspartate racemase
MAKQIGIVACSAEGAALCYQTICRESPERMGKHYHPVITMHTWPLGSYMKAVEVRDWNAVASLMQKSAEILSTAGAQIIICPDNTIHQAFDLIEKQDDVEWLHIAVEVAKEAQRREFGKLGILGTQYLMEGPVYAQVLKKFDISFEIPAEEIRIHTRSFFHQQIQALRESGCQAAVLGCTEIPLIVDAKTAPLPTLDSTRILARAAIEAALIEEV